LSKLARNSESGGDKGRRQSEGSSRREGDCAPLRALPSRSSNQFAPDASVAGLSESRKSRSSASGKFAFSRRASRNSSFARPRTTKGRIWTTLVRENRSRRSHEIRTRTAGRVQALPSEGREDKGKILRLRMG